MRKIQTATTSSCYRFIFQGGCADLSSVVAEAEKKIMQILKHLAKYIGHLATVTGSDLSFTDGNRGDESNAKVK